MQSAEMEAPADICRPDHAMAIRFHCAPTEAGRSAP